MTVLITGGDGFVGSNLDADYKATRADADLRDFDQAKALFARVKPKTIIHAAAKHGNYAQIEEDKVGYYRENALININVFEAARLNQVENIIAFSSVTAFPDRLNKFSEDDLYDGEPHASCYPYAYAKRIIEVLCRAYTDQFVLNYNCIFLANAYGPNGKDNVIPVVIQKCLKAKKLNIPFEVVGDGTPRRDFIFMEDVKHIINQLMHIKHSGPLILSSGTNVSIAFRNLLVANAVSAIGAIIPFTPNDSAL